MRPRSSVLTSALSRKTRAGPGSYLSLETQPERAPGDPFRGAAGANQPELVDAVRALGTDADDNVRSVRMSKRVDRGAACRSRRPRQPPEDFSALPFDESRLIRSRCPRRRHGDHARAIPGEGHDSLVIEPGEFLTVGGSANNGGAKARPIRRCRLLGEVLAVV